MRSTPLQLEHYFFTRIHVEVNPDFVAPKRDQLQPDTVVARVEVYRHEEDQSRYQITLTVDEVTSDEGALPYELDVQVVGFFNVEPDLEPDITKRLVEVNGASMLYTAAREYILMVTGRAPWGAIQLPTVNFHWVITQREANNEKKGKRTKKSSKPAVP